MPGITSEALEIATFRRLLSGSTSHDSATTCLWAALTPASHADGRVTSPAAAAAQLLRALHAPSAVGASGTGFPLAQGPRLQDWNLGREVRVQDWHLARVPK